MTHLIEVSTVDIIIRIFAGLCAITTLILVYWDNTRSRDNKK